MTIQHPDKHIPLTPIVHSWVRAFLMQKESIQAAIQQYGSPLNIHCLQPLTENIMVYRQLAAKLNLRYRLFFARKANKNLPLALKSVALGQGVDTASYRELRQCVDAGIPPEALILTAAVKNERLLEFAVDNQVTVVIDNRDELNLLTTIVKEKQQKINVNIRIGGFDLGDRKLHSRFGFSVSDALELILEINRDEPLLYYTGLHFHLNGYSIDERSAAIEQCIQLIDELKAQGIDTLLLDIGGGFLMNYLTNKSEWETFHSELKKAVMGEREPLTYQNDPLGMVRIGNDLYGEPTVYPYYNETHKVLFLEAVLSSYSDTYRRPLYELIRERNIELRMEPGRSLLDQVGITVASVAFRKKDSEGNLLVGLEMNRTQLRSSSADFLLDPIHLTMHENDGDTAPCYGYLVGAYCLEQELILKRKIKFEQFPEIGDFIVFPNTAGYMMHFFESEAHLFELAKNLFYDLEGKQLRALV